MSEIKRKLIRLREGESHTADGDGAVIITSQHTYSDVLRYVAEDLGSEALYLLRDILIEQGTEILPDKDDWPRS